MLVCFRRCKQVILRMINMYVERNYDLGEKDDYKRHFLNIVCEHRQMSIIKFVIDVCFGKKLNICYRNHMSMSMSIEQSLNANKNLKNRAIQMYLNELETDVFEST